jgi:hypothetical protein
MFRQNNAILRERLWSFLSHFIVNMVGDKLQDIWRNVHTDVLYSIHVSVKQCHPQGATVFLSEPLLRQYGRRQVTEHMTERTYRRAI